MQLKSSLKREGNARLERPSSGRALLTWSFMRLWKPSAPTSIDFLGLKTRRWINVYKKRNAQWVCPFSIGLTRRLLNRPWAVSFEQYLGDRMGNKELDSNNHYRDGYGLITDNLSVADKNFDNSIMPLKYPYPNRTETFGHDQLHRDPGLEDLLRVQSWVGILELLVFVVGTPANIVVLCLALIRKKSSDIQAGRKRNITKYLVISMTFADLLFCGVHSPMMFLSYSRGVDFSAVPCVALFAVTHMATVASSLSLLLINIDKFLHLRRPLHYAVYVTTNRGLLSVLLCWIVSIGWSLLFIFGSYIEYNERCDVRVTDKGIYILFAVGFFVVPTVISLVISVYVAVVVFEARVRTKRSRKQARCERFHLQVDSHSGYTSVCTNGSIRRPGGSTKTKTPRASNTSSSENRNPHYISCPSVQLDKSSQSGGCAPGTGTSSTNYLLAPSPLKRTISLGHSPPNGTTPAPSRRQHHQQQPHGHQFRRIGFVFTTTLWSTFTVLPYRLCFIIWNLTTYEATLMTDRTAESVYFCLFAIMALNAAGNPFITIMTQRQYSAKLAKIWHRLVQKKNSLGKLAKAADILHFGRSDMNSERRRLSIWYAGTAFLQPSSVRRVDRTALLHPIHQHW